MADGRAELRLRRREGMPGDVLQRRSLLGAAAALLVASSLARAQQARRPPRVALVSSFASASVQGADPTDAFARAFILALRDLGLVDGRDIVDEVLDTGLVDSLARPGHNVSGIGESDVAIHGKRLQLLAGGTGDFARRRHHLHARAERPW